MRVWEEGVRDGWQVGGREERQEGGREGGRENSDAKAAAVAARIVAAVQMQLEIRICHTEEFDAEDAEKPFKLTGNAVCSARCAQWCLCMLSPVRESEWHLLRCCAAGRSLCALYAACCVLQAAWRVILCR